MEVPRLEVAYDLYLAAYATVTAMPDPTRACHLHHSSWQHQILNLLSKAGIEPESSWMLVRFVSAQPQWKLLAGSTLKKNKGCE